MIDKDEKIQYRIDMDMLSRAKTGIFLYAIVMPVVFWPFDFYQLQPELSVIFALSMLIVSLLRAVHHVFAERIYGYSARLWRGMFFLLSGCHACILSIFFVLSIYDERFTPILHVTMLAIGGICSGAVVALIPRIKFALTNLTILLGPSIIMGLVIEGKLPFAGMIAAYYGFIAMIGVRSSKEYIRSFEIELKLDEQNSELEKQSKIDALTTIYNRGYFNSELEKQWDYATRLNLTVTVLLIDIDHFKSFNDNYGHLVGDACLIHIATTLDKAGKRKTDLVARFGGEEFVLLLLESGKSEAPAIAEMLRRKIEETPFVLNGRELPVTASIGVASVQPDAKMKPKRLIEQADAALYTAKAAGRNRVNIFHDTTQITTI
ncbi:GGDEF domain-containing protein [Aliiglaciecola litoralis]|uniref:diguanylate cyclase n=1 Tax=Aliiglaciecola litoralis TaxID=582857 RepID=A0ABN1LR25_9ALTE